MKLTKKIMLATAGVAIAALVSLSTISCASSGKTTVKEKAQKTAIEQTNDALKTVDTSKTAKQGLINWLYRDMGYKITDMPNWLKIYTKQGIKGIESMADYKTDYCFVARETGANLEFVTTWANSYNVQNQVGGWLRTAVSDIQEAQQQGTRNTGDNASDSNDTNNSASNDSLANRLGTSIESMVTGLKRVDDYWTETRIYDLDDAKKYTDTYTYYVLYTIDRKTLDLEIASALKNNISSDSALADLATSVASQITKNGLNNNEKVFDGDKADKTALAASQTAINDALDISSAAPTDSGTKTNKAAVSK